MKFESSYPITSPLIDKSLEISWGLLLYMPFSVSNLEVSTVKTPKRPVGGRSRVCSIDMSSYGMNGFSMDFSVGSWLLL